MSTTVATITAISAANAATAANIENERKRIACEAWMPSFQHQGATVAQIQQYAGCARLTTPMEMSPEGVIAAKVIVALFVLAFMIGAVRGEGYGDSLLDRSMVGILWMVGLFCVLLFLAAVGFVLFA